VTLKFNHKWFDCKVNLNNAVLNQSCATHSDRQFC